MRYGGGLYIDGELAMKTMGSRCGGEFELEAALWVLVKMRQMGSRREMVVHRGMASSIALESAMDELNGLMYLSFMDDRLIYGVIPCHLGY